MVFTVWLEMREKRRGLCYLILPFAAAGSTCLDQAALHTARTIS